MSQFEPWRPGRVLVAHEAHTWGVNSVAFSPDGKSVASGSEDRTVRIWDTQRPLPIGNPFIGHTAAIYSVTYSPLGNLIASGSLDCTIRLWDTSNGRPSGSPLKGHQDHVNSVAFSPNAKLIASGSDDRTVRLWDVENGGAACKPLNGHSGWIRSVAFSPESTHVVSGSDDRLICIWDAERGVTIVRPLVGHAGAVNWVAFSPNGSHIASGSRDTTVRLWDIRSGTMTGKPYEGHTGHIESIIFSADGTWIISASNDKTIRMWDIRSGRSLVESLEGPPDDCYSVAFSPSGTRIASSYGNGKVVVCSILGGDSNSGPDLNAMLNEYIKPSGTANPELIDRHMSIREMFNRLLSHGCVNLAFKMDTEQDTAVIVSGGGFGDIWLGKLRNGSKVAIKAWRASAIEQCDYKTLKVGPDTHGFQHATQEIHFWSRMKHQNIHQLMGVILFKSVYLGMVSEWMENGNLHEYMRKYPGFDRYKMCVQITAGLEYMHQNNAVHGDLKALNVLVSSEGVAKLSDFGLSTMSEASLAFSNTSNTQIGSIRWAAPEQLLGDASTSKPSDIYALAMTILEVFTGKVPYPECQKDYQVLKLMQKGTIPTRPNGPLKDDKQSNRMWDLLVCCWNHEASSRPPATGVLKSIVDLAGLKEHVNQNSMSTLGAGEPGSTAGKRRPVRLLSIGERMIEKGSHTLELKIPEDIYDDPAEERAEVAEQDVRITKPSPKVPAPTLNLEVHPDETTPGAAALEEIAALKRELAETRDKLNRACALNSLSYESRRLPMPPTFQTGLPNQYASHQYSSAQRSHEPTSTAVKRQRSHSFDERIMVGKQSQANNPRDVLVVYNKPGDLLLRFNNGPEDNYDDHAEEHIRALADLDRLDQEVYDGLILGLKIPSPAGANAPSLKEVMFPGNLISLISNGMWRYGMIKESERFLANTMQTIQGHVMSFTGENAIVPGVFWLSNVHEIYSFVCHAEADMMRGIGPTSESPNYDWPAYQHLIQMVKTDLDSLEYNIYHSWMVETKKRLSKMIIPALIETQSLPGFITSEGAGRLFNLFLNQNTAPAFNMDDVLNLLNEVMKCLECFFMEKSVVEQVVTELLKLVGVTSFNDLLMRRNFCSWKRAMQIQHNITRIEEWCKSHKMSEGTLQLEHLMQATKLLLLKKATQADIDIIYDLCWILTPSQIQRMCANYFNPISPEIMKLVARRVQPDDRTDHLMLMPENEDVAPYELPLTREVASLDNYVPTYLNIPHIRRLAAITP